MSTLPLLSCPGNERVESDDLVLIALTLKDNVRTGLEKVLYTTAFVHRDLFSSI